MTRYVLRRLVQIIITFFLFQTLTFFLLYAQPGDIANQYLLNPNLPPDAAEQLRKELGLDKPPHLQYIQYMKNFLTGNLGVSFTNYPRPVIDIIKERLPRTLVLFFTATVISFYVGFALGKLLAWKRGGLFEYATTVVGVTLYTVFTPWFALMMIWLFAYKWNLFPTGKFITPTLWRNTPFTANDVFLRMIWTGVWGGVVAVAAYLLFRRLPPPYRFFSGFLALFVGIIAAVIPWIHSPMARYALDILWHMILPIATLTLISFAGTMLLTRNSLLETMREDYILAARAKGLPEKVVRDKHAARTALLPVVTSLVFSLAFAIDGGVITETMFSWPGMGLTLLNAVVQEDIPLAMGAFSFTGMLALLAHLAADLLYAYLDPRIRYS
ncbi:MAG: ABC transporter permease [Chloroflexi bacterium]|nr:ABC transporter permease [Chloroflexota bacterium]